MNEAAPFRDAERLDKKYKKGDYKALVKLNKDLKKTLLEIKRTECAYE